jgi:hypothetical protein
MWMIHMSFVQSLLCQHPYKAPHHKNHHSKLLVEDYVDGFE